MKCDWCKEDFESGLIKIRDRWVCPECTGKYYTDEELKTLILFRGY